MKIEHTLTVPVSDRLLKERASAYLLNTGYRPVKGSENTVYQRGSLLGSLFSFTPIGWRARVEIRANPGVGETQASLEIDINTTGQMMTQKERTFWKNEIEGLTLAVKTGNIVSKPSFEAAGASKAQNVTAAGIIICLAVLLAVIFRATYGTSLAGYLGGVIGVVSGFGIAVLTLKIKR